LPIPGTYLRSPVVGEERIRLVGDCFPGRSRCFVVASVLRHWWLDDGKDIRSVKTCATYLTKVGFWNRRRKNTKGNWLTRVHLSNVVQMKVLVLTRVADVVAGRNRQSATDAVQTQRTDVATGNVEARFSSVINNCPTC